jgi:sporulation protein YlmC with PRC-barrel domain
MAIEYGIEVVDKSGKPLGTVDYVIRNSWTGEISKFTVRQGVSKGYLSFSPGDILEEKESKIRLGVSSNELMSN